MPKENRIRVCISVPESLFARIEPAVKQSTSAKVVELIEKGLKGESLILRQNIVIRPD